MNFRYLDMHFIIKIVLKSLSLYIYRENKSLYEIGVFQTMKRHEANRILINLGWEKMY